MKIKNGERGVETLFSFFDESEQIAYQSPKHLISQHNYDTCVAACARMILADFGIDAPESYLASALETEGGAMMSKLPQVLKDFNLPQSYEWRKDLSLADLNAALKNGSAIVSVRRKDANFGHALVVDAIFNNEIRLRDPLPKGAGKSYAVRVEKFSEVFLRNRQAGTGVIYVE
jgi:ABC-type bacteriocin/lantibiotic exporter with double-glycine peptidase domain